MSSFPDPIQEGLKRGWKVIDGAGNERPPEVFDCDVAIIGTGAGGGITAEILSRNGLKVILVEEGPLKSSSDFKMREADAYPQLYQESAARKTADKAINILQGRSVGGSTTVNWTSSFRTPRPTLEWWAAHHDLKNFSAEDLAPYFAQAEARLGVAPWLVPPNENNDLLRRGAGKLGIPAAAILRNVRGCVNLGYCGMGCPTNAKQSMLVTTIPAALDRGALLLTRARAQRLQIAANTQGRKVEAIQIEWLDSTGLKTTGRRSAIRARHYVLAGGAINSPALLLRSELPDPHKLTGKRTFLHPTVVSAGIYTQEVNGFSGAPQTIYTDHFLDIHPIDGPVGYKLEAPPIHPLLFATTTQGFGSSHAKLMSAFAHTHALLALLRDGFHPQSAGGTVKLKSDGSAVLDYPLTDVIFDGIRRALLSMAEIQFAAGAKEVTPVHEMAQPYTTWAQARQAIGELPMKPLLTRIVSAHVMGGCAISGNDRLGLVRPDGIHHHVENLSIHDGSLFPTSIGANPQLSIYGITTKLSTWLASTLIGKPAEGLLKVS
jgi:choline dehydrogenase-like flavoprotein